MYDELVKRLRHSANFAERGLTPPPSELREAADAIEELSKKLDESIPKSDAEIIIEELSKPRWIPVTERLPERGKYVLAYSADDDYMTVEERHKFEAFQITHWMPLPEPPKEVE